MCRNWLPTTNHSDTGRFRQLGSWAQLTVKFPNSCPASASHRLQLQAQDVICVKVGKARGSGLAAGRDARDCGQQGGCGLSSQRGVSATRLSSSSDRRAPPRPACRAIGSAAALATARVVGYHELPWLCWLCARNEAARLGRANESVDWAASSPGRRGLAPAPATVPDRPPRFTSVLAWLVAGMLTSVGAVAESCDSGPTP